MAEYHKVRGSREISIRIADLLEDMRGCGFSASRAETVRDINDVLQGRGSLSIVSLLSKLQKMGGFDYGPRVDAIEQDIQAFLEQKALLSVPYTKTNRRRYRYGTFAFDPNHPLKTVNQFCYDRAVKDGFPPGFFSNSNFDRVSFYCMPDWTDFSGSRFNACDFSVCRIVGANFTDTTMCSSSFSSCRIRDASFSGATLAHTHFQDCDMERITFEGARLSRGNFLDCSMSDVDFLAAVLDGVSCGHVTPSEIKNLNTATITAGGATTEEVKRLRASIFEALQVPDISLIQKKRPVPHNSRRAGPER